MKIRSWMYVSDSLIAPEPHDAVLDEMVALARAKNERLDVTGCLLSAGGRFAQIIEGPPDAIADLRRSIQADPRHTRVTTVDVEQTETRRFTDWSLAYAGPSFFVEKYTARARSQTGKAKEQPIEDLLLLMQQLSLWRDIIAPKLH